MNTAGRTVLHVRASAVLYCTVIVILSVHRYWYLCIVRYIVLAVMLVICLKPSFHYPSSWPEFTGRVDGPWTPVHFLTPELTARVDGCQKMHPSWPHLNSGSGNRALMPKISVLGIVGVRPWRVGQFFYLSSTITTGGNSFPKVVWRIVITSTAMSCLYMIWRYSRLCCHCSEM